MRATALLLATLAVTLTGCERPDKSAQIEEGAGIFAANCATCHGPAGDVRNAETYDADTPDLRQIASKTSGRLPLSALTEMIDGRRVIKGHARSMPAWGETLGEGDDELAAKRIASLLAYIESIQQR